MPQNDLGSGIHSRDALTALPERLLQLEAGIPMSQRTRQNLGAAVASVDPVAHREFLSRYNDELQDVATFGAAKYADIAYWAYRNVLIAEWLDLDRSEPLDILDIGMGSGSFAMVAQSMGHRVVGTDAANRFYHDLSQVARTTRIVAPVAKGVRYVPVATKFDLITIMLPVFHRVRVDGARRYWTTEDWRLFLRALVEDLLKPKGRIFILMPLDKDDQGTLSYSPLLNWAYARGARLDRTFPEGPIRHILFDAASAETFGPEEPAPNQHPDVAAGWTRR